MKNLSKKDQKLIREILELKKEKNAVILVHNYQPPEIYEVGDFIGDSFDLSKKAAETNAEKIIFCGVDFMAESAKILNPDKEVFLPAKFAKCPMATMVTAEELEEFKKKYPDAAVVCYINTSAEVKAVSDVCCTSSNAVKVVNALPNDEIIFVPDKNLADYVKRYTKKKIISWEGFCYVHDSFKKKDVLRAKESHPHAEIVVHPECRREVIRLADYVCSTSKMIDYARKSESQEFLIFTEMGMIFRLQRELQKDFPEKKFYSPLRFCSQMKSNSLELVKDSLIKESGRVIVPEEIARKAKRALDKMLEIGT